MKILCDKSILESALAPVLFAIPIKESPKPGLKSIHISARDGRVIFRTSNMELSVESSLDAVQIDREGEILVPARPLSQLVREISDPTISLEWADGKLKLPTSSGEFEIVTSDPADFPELNFFADETVIEVPLEGLQGLLQSTEFACAREATKYAMNGILLSLESGSLSMVATDGRRLALNSLPVDVDENVSFEVLLPHKSFAAAIKAMAASKVEKVNIGNGDGHVCFHHAEGKMSILKIVGSFPDYKAVVPRDTSNSVEINRILFESNLRRTAVMTEELNPAVRINFEGNQAKFSSDAAGVGSANTNMDVKISGPGGQIILNPHFVFDALKVAQIESIRFEFDDGNSPGKFVLGEQFFYVVMPITGL